LQRRHAQQRNRHRRRRMGMICGMVMMGHMKCYNIT
jgi:hypothetical protein